MAPALDQIVIIGCSAGGKEACEYLLPKLFLGSSAVVIVPHINNNAIYSCLRSRHLPVHGVEDTTALRPGKIYVEGHNYQSKPSGCLGFLDDLAVRLPLGSDSIDETFVHASEEYKERCIGVILSGAGSDGSRGGRELVKNGGKLLIQVERSSQKNLSAGQRFQHYGYWYCSGMPRNAREATKPFFSGSLERMAKALNQLLAVRILLQSLFK